MLCVCYLHVYLCVCCWFSLCVPCVCSFCADHLFLTCFVALVSTVVFLLVIVVCDCVCLLLLPSLFVCCISFPCAFTLVFWVCLVFEVSCLRFPSVVFFVLPCLLFTLLAWPCVRPCFVSWCLVFVLLWFALVSLFGFHMCVRWFGLVQWSSGADVRWCAVVRWCGGPVVWRRLQSLGTRPSEVPREPFLLLWSDAAFLISPVVDLFLELFRRSSRQRANVEIQIDQDCGTESMLCQSVHRAM